MKRIISGLLLAIFFSVAASMLLSVDCQAQNPISREKKEQKPVQKPKEQPKHTPKSAPEVKVHDARTSYRNMDLQTRRNGQYYNINPDEWGALTAAQKALFTPEGVVVKYENEEFVVDLEDQNNGRKYNWDEAMFLYGDILPTKAQGEIMVKYGDIFNERLAAYGGQMMDSFYWTCTGYDSPPVAYLVTMNCVGSGIGDDYKTEPHSVRTIFPIPIASEE